MKGRFARSFVPTARREWESGPEIARSGGWASSPVSSPGAPVGAAALEGRRRRGEEEARGGVEWSTRVRIWLGLGSISGSIAWGGLTEEGDE
jgi:hypothetical protein